MIFLAGSIIFTSFLAIALKICGRLRIDTFQSIIFNYLTCTITGSVINGSAPDYTQVSKEEWFPWACVMGFFFIIFFNLTALTVKQSGVAVTSVATKLSLVIPFIFSVYLYDERAGLIKITGILLALFAVLLTCYQKKDVHHTTNAMSWKVLRLPVMVFFGTGILDTIIKYTEQRYITPETRDIFLTASFTVAFLAGAVYYVVELLRKKRRFQFRAVIAGVCIGIPNYLSIWCLVIALKKFASDSSVIIPVNNIGIVFLSAIVSWLFLRERLSAINWLGIILAMVAITLISLNI